MGKVVHFEIPATDPAAAMRFYEKVFGWTYQLFPGQEYWFAIGGDEEARGSNGAIMKRADPSQPVTVTVEVPDLDATLATVAREGGVVVVPKSPVPGMGWFAFFKDPDGNIVGAWAHDPGAA